MVSQQITSENLTLFLIEYLFANCVTPGTMAEDICAGQLLFGKNNVVVPVGVSFDQHIGAIRW